MDVIGLGVALVVGIAIGYGLSMVMGGRQTESEAADTAGGDTPDWYKTRQALTGTQLQILKYMEVRRQVSITKLQEKFSFIPDRELYYRLEQIVLMGFLERVRKEGEVYYVLNQEYSVTVEDDKTVMLGGD